MYLLDTNICIYIIKQKPQHVLDTLMRIDFNDIAISTITLAELEYGVEKSLHKEKNKIALLEFLSVFQIIEFNDKDAIEYGKIRADLERCGQPVGAKDMLIAAQARARDYILVSNNTKEFERITQLKFENWVKSIFLN